MENNSAMAHNIPHLKLSKCTFSITTIYIWVGIFLPYLYIIRLKPAFHLSVLMDVRKMEGMTPTEYLQKHT